MVNIVEDAISIDKQGRLILPSHIRSALKLKEGGHVSVRLHGSRIILEPIHKDVEENVVEWANLALSLNGEALAEKPNESWKWISREYARRKIGLS